MKVIAKNVIKLKEIDSTSDEAKRLIRAGKGEGVVVLAETQTRGRGKPGSGWFSPKGVGIYLSAVVQPYKNPNDLGPITELGARAVISLIKQASGLTASIKLPNDVLLNGKKIAGILVERLARGKIIIGIGVNINNDKGTFPRDIKLSATSLKIETDDVYEIDKMIDVLLNELDREYLAYLEGI